MAHRVASGFPVCAVMLVIALCSTAPARGGVVINSATRTATASVGSSGLKDIKSSASLGQYDDTASITCGPVPTNSGYAEVHSFIGNEGLTMSGNVSGSDFGSCNGGSGLGLGQDKLVVNFTVTSGSVRWAQTLSAGGGPAGGQGDIWDHPISIKTTAGDFVNGAQAASGTLIKGTYTLTFLAEAGHAVFSPGSSQMTFDWSFKFLTACCMPNNSCVDMTPSDCVAADGTPCSSNPCHCSADFNSSGSLSPQDLFDFLAAYFSHSASADVNSSGSVTLQDIFDYLSMFFAGCA